MSGSFELKRLYIITISRILSNEKKFSQALSELSDFAFKKSVNVFNSTHFKNQSSHVTKSSMIIQGCKLTHVLLLTSGDCCFIWQQCNFLVASYSNLCILVVIGLD